MNTIIFDKVSHREISVEDIPKNQYFMGSPGRIGSDKLLLIGSDELLLKTHDEVVSACEPEICWDSKGLTIYNYRPVDVEIHVKEAK